MSIMEVDQLTYDRLFDEARARYKRRGYGEAESHLLAQQIIDQCFTCAEANMTREGEADQRENGIYG